LPDAAQATNIGCPTMIGPGKEWKMTRKYIDCRTMPSENKCTVALSADSDDELIEAAVQHAVACHKYQDSPELRKQLRGMFKDGSPPL
jgi:predicted small metal-binding protein